MIPEYTIEGKMEAYKSSQSKFTAIVNRLCSSAFNGKEHHFIEEELEREGRELCRLLYQDFLNSLSENEPRYSAVEGTDGVIRHRSRKSRREMESIFGRVEIERWRYYTDKTSKVPGLFVLDAQLNLPPVLHSHGLQARVCRLTAKESYDETAQDVQRTTGGHIPKASIEKSAAYSSQDFDDFYERTGHTTEPPDDSLIVVTQDGKGIVMRHDDLREETKKAAEKQAAQNGGHGLDNTEKRNRKRLATVAAIYDVQPHYREPEEIMGTTKSSGAKKESKERPKPMNKRVWASVSKPMEEVTAQAFEEVLHRDPEKKRTVVVLVDGLDYQIARVKQEAKKAGVSITIVLDLIHVLEKLWKAGVALHPNAETSKIQEWYQERALRILKGEALLVGAGIRRAATMLSLSKSQRKPIDKCADYLQNNKKYVRYNEFLKKGFPIATGVIEGACRYLVKRRMDLSAARWSLEGAEAVLFLRALEKNGDFDRYWDYHIDREKHRNYESKIANFYLPKVA